MAGIGEVIINDDNTYTVTRYIWPDGGDHGPISTERRKELFRLFQVIVAPLIILTALRTVPGEVRIWTRVYRRKSLRMAEVLFFVLKYTALTSACLDVLVQFGGTSWMGPNGERCRPFWWCVKLGYYSCISIVCCVVAFRCWIIFGCSRRVAAILGVGVLVHFAATLAVAVTDVNREGLYLGSCTFDSDLFDNTELVFWYLATCIAFDVSVTAAGSYQLLKSRFGRFKMHKVTALLFWHNVHYVAILSCINITQCILYAVPFDVPSFTFFTAALTIDLGLQQLIIEADTVNGVVTCRVDEYEPKAFVSGSALRKGESVGGADDIERVNKSDAATTREPSEDLDGASDVASSRCWGSSVPLVDMPHRDDASSRLEILDVPRHDAASSNTERRSQSP